MEARSSKLQKHNSQDPDAVSHELGFRNVGSEGSEETAGQNPKRSLHNTFGQGVKKQNMNQDEKLCMNQAYPLLEEFLT